MDKVEQAARCSCLEVHGEDPRCFKHGDIAYLVSLAFAVAEEGIVFDNLEDPMEWIVRRWDELEGDPEKEFTGTDLATAIRSRTGEG